MTCPYGADHPEFVLTMYPQGITDLSACWDSTNIRKIAQDLREIADGLDELPADYEGRGVPPL
jgi:hypothetical protein